MQLKFAPQPFSGQQKQRQVTVRKYASAGRLTLSTDIYGQEEPRKTQSDDEQRLVDKIKEEVLKELQSGEFLRQQIQLGIQDCINKQREAQVAAKLSNAVSQRKNQKCSPRVAEERSHLW